jgi:excisionase family DNA binding protein
MTPKQLPELHLVRKSETELVSVEQAAQILSVSVSTLYGWVWQRRIAFVKLGRALRFDVSDLQEFIRRNRVQPRASAKF